jgi:hypothetical protein
VVTSIRDATVMLTERTEDRSSQVRRHSVTCFIQGKVAWQVCCAALCEDKACPADSAIVVNYTEWRAVATRAWPLSMTSSSASSERTGNASPRQHPDATAAGHRAEWLPNPELR